MKSGASPAKTKRGRWRGMFAVLISGLALAIPLATPGTAAANTCDGTHLRAAQTNSDGSDVGPGEVNSLDYPAETGEFNIARTGAKHYLTLTGVVRPSTEGVFAFVRENPDVEVFRYRTTSAGSNGVIAHERNIVDLNTFANAGDRRRVGVFFGTRFCGDVLTNLGWINVLP